ncbi:MAG TPA: AarF/UbiB family protein [Thermoanaerobaculia bacterium]|nr:AarF/UbiB family protein [Thermoanaerobaculia bacterium]
MSLSLKPRHLRRYKDVAALALKYRNLSLVPAEGAEAAAPRRGGPDPAELAADLERLGPTFVKLGQLLSARTDLLPPAYLDALRRLQDKVEPFSYAEVEEIVQGELGARISKAFSSFEKEPAAAASLGQVHRAALRDGRPVAVKVQRPGIREQISDDLEAFREIAEILAGHTEPFDVETMLEEFRKTLLKELDYRQEAQNMVTLGAALEEFPRIVVPQPVDDYTTTRVLTMDLISGKKVTSLSPLTKLDIDGSGLAEELFRAYLKQTLLDGFFHADPHPGNVFLTDDRRIALLDLGMVARLTPALREQLLKLVIAVSDGRGDQAAGEVEKIGDKLPDFDGKEMTRRVVELVGVFQHATVSDLQLGRIVMDISRLAAESGLKLPPELTMVGKTLLNLDEVGRTLDPAFDPNASIRRNSAELLARSLRQSATPGNVASSLLEAREFLGRLPARVEKILDLVSTNSLRVQVDTIDERELIAGIQKIANRIALGLVLAALIVGAALLTQVQTTFRIFGYPGLAMIFFLVAAAGGAALAANIVLSDRKLP